MAESAPQPIGGYFALELPLRRPFHEGAVAVNTGRNALRYLLLARRPARVHLPRFNCSAVAETVASLGLTIVPYGIDEALEPRVDVAALGHDEVLVYPNYFGLKDLFIRGLARRTQSVIVDDAQAFFSPRVGTFDTFYSARKFFGVPDGAYAYGGGTQSLEPDQSSERAAHLLIRHDVSAPAGYAAYQANEATLAKEPLKAMSALSARLLRSIDYAEVATRRRAHFQRLHRVLGSSNGLPIDEDDERVPLTYPYLSADPGLQARLLRQNIFTATYWPEVARVAGPGTVEHHYSTQLVHLPIDQRLGEADLARIIEAVS